MAEAAGEAKKAVKKDEKKSFLFRATFESTLDNQKKLFELIETLITENKPILPDKRNYMLEMFGRATLGTGTTVPAGVSGGSFIFRSVNQNIEIKNAEELFGFVVFLGTDTLILGNEKVIQISEVWRNVRALLLKIRPLAISRALAISAERIEAPDRRQFGKEPTWI